MQVLALVKSLARSKLRKEIYGEQTEGVLFLINEIEAVLKDSYTSEVRPWTTNEKDHRTAKYVSNARLNSAALVQEFMALHLPQINLQGGGNEFDGFDQKLLARSLETWS